MTITQEEISTLTWAEKQQLVEMILDSMESKDEVPVYDDLEEESEEELQILNERLEEYERDPSACIPWEEAFAKYKNRAK